MPWLRLIISGPKCRITLATPLILISTTALNSMAEELPSGMACVPLSPGVVNTTMLQSCFGNGADTAIKPKTFAKVAAPFLLRLGPKDNGQSLTVPNN